MTQPNLPYDPELKEAAAEIKALMERRGIAGAFTLASPTHAEHLVHFAPWMVVKFEGEGAVRIRCKREDYPSREAQKQAMEETAHVIMRFKDISALHFKLMELLEGKIQAAGIEIEHDSGGYTPHRRQ